MIGDEHRDATLLAIGSEMESSIRVSIGTGGDAAKLDCAALVAAYPKRPALAKGTLIDFWAVHPLEADGQHAPWAVRSSYITDERGGRGGVTRGGLMKDLAASASSIDLTTLELAIQDPQNPVGLTTWQGDMQVENCGRVKRKTRARPQEKLTLTISGKRFAIHGATLRDEAKKRYLQLTRSPHACAETPTEGYDLVLDLAFSSNDPPKVAFASLQGDLFPESPAGSDGKEAFQIAMSGKRGDDEIIKLDGTLKLHGFTLSLKGEVTPVRCK